MAQTTTLEGLRSQILTSVHGRRLGIDPNDYLVGPKDFRKPVASNTAVSGTLNAYGVTSIGVSTAAPTYSMDYPVPGVEAILAFTTTAVTSLAITINASTGSYFQTTAGATFQTITVSSATANYIGQTLSLVGLSTSVWMVKNGLATAMVAS